MTLDIQPADGVSKFPHKTQGMLAQEADFRLPSVLEIDPAKINLSDTLFEAPLAERYLQLKAARTWERIKVPEKHRITTFLGLLTGSYGVQIDDYEMPALMANAKSRRERDEATAQLAHFRMQLDKWLETIKGYPTLVAFGTARDKAVDPLHTEIAHHIAVKTARFGLHVRTGAGPGIMATYAKEWYENQGAVQGVPLHFYSDLKSEPRSIYYTKGLMAPPQAVFGTRSPLMLAREAVCLLYNPGGKGTDEEIAVADLARQMRIFNHTIYTGRDALSIPPLVFLDRKTPSGKWYWGAKLLERLSVDLEIGAIRPDETDRFFVIRVGEEEPARTDIGLAKVLYSRDAEAAAETIVDLTHKQYLSLKSFYESEN